MCFETVIFIPKYILTELTRNIYIFSWFEKNLLDFVKNLTEKNSSLYMVCNSSYLSSNGQPPLLESNVPESKS